MQLRIPLVTWVSPVRQVMQVRERLIGSKGSVGHAVSSHLAKVPQEATGAVLGLLAPFKSDSTSRVSGGQADAALQHIPKVATSLVPIAADSSLQQLTAVGSHMVAAPATQGDDVPVLPGGMHAAVGHAADESQLLQA